MDQPVGLWISGGQLYMVEFVESTVRAISANGTITTIAGRADTKRERIDGIGGDARLNSPTGVAVSSTGQVFVFEAAAIRKGVSVAADADFNSRLTNVSVRSVAGSGDQSLIVGYVVSGAGSKQVLVRAIGPTLAKFGVINPLADPTLNVMNGAGTVVDQNDNWGGTTALKNTFSRLGTFGMDDGSKDSSVVSTSTVGSYTAQISGVGGSSGVVLAELYEADTGTVSARFANISARNFVGKNDDLLIAGFTVSGLANKTLLIRGVGPGLAQFGVGGVLADPEIRVFLGGEVIAQNDTWASGDASTFTRVGAFSLASKSKDAAMVITLPPGSYTVQVTGVGGTTGAALVEVYEVP
jgi:hypothetical protein